MPLAVVAFVTVVAVVPVISARVLSVRVAVGRRRGLRGRAAAAEREEEGEEARGQTRHGRAPWHGVRAAQGPPLPRDRQSLAASQSSRLGTGSGGAMAPRARASA